ncbi:uncharacterized protein METZ01_LOCUS179819, partial [marine metagenome]
MIGPHIPLVWTYRLQASIPTVSRSVVAMVYLLNQIPRALPPIIISRSR